MATAVKEREEKATPAPVYPELPSLFRPGLLTSPWFEMERIRTMLESMWEPRRPFVNLYRHENNLVLEAALPGMEAEGIKLTVTERSVGIVAEHKTEKKTEEKDHFYSELRHGRIERTVTLPLGVDAMKAAATYKDGVLHLTMPLREVSEPVNVPVT